MATLQIESLMAGFIDDRSNLPLAGGKVFSYDSGTTSPKVLYQDANKGSVHTNPLILDAQGTALAFGEGRYRLVIKDANDRTVYTRDEVLYQSDLSVSRETKSITGNYDLLAADEYIFANANTSSIVVNLPDVSANASKHYSIKKIDSTGNTVTLDASGSSLIDGAGTRVLRDQHETVDVYSDGASWYRVPIPGPDSLTGGADLPGNNKVWGTDDSGDVSWRDQQVLVSNNDTSLGYLSDKITGGTNITVVESNDGGNETLDVSLTGGSDSPGNFKYYGADVSGTVGMHDLSSYSGLLSINDERASENGELNLSIPLPYNCDWMATARFYQESGGDLSASVEGPDGMNEKFFSGNCPDGGGGLVLSHTGTPANAGDYIEAHLASGGLSSKKYIYLTVQYGVSA